MVFNMLGKLTQVCCFSGIPRQICRKLLTTSASCQTNLAAAAVAVAPATSSRSYQDWISSGRPSFKEFLTVVPCHTDGSRQFASRASKFGKKIKKETRDRYSGLDPSRLQHGFEQVKELEDASEDVRKIFTLEFATGNQIKKVHKAETLAIVENDPTDRDYSNRLTATITKFTVTLKTLAPHVERFPRDKRTKRKMLMMLDRRRKLIKKLLHMNYDLANGLLQKLNLKYTPPPRYSRRFSKRAMEKKTIHKQGIRERNTAMKEFAKALQEEQLREISELKKDLKMELSEEERNRLPQE